MCRKLGKRKKRELEERDTRTPEEVRADTAKLFDQLTEMFKELDKKGAIR